jgi:peroxiredoxin
LRLLPLLLLCSLGCATTGASSDKSSASSDTGTATVERAAGDFTARDIEGRTVRLSDYAGKIVLIDFWATWCEPCMAELPHLGQLYKTYKDQGFVVLGVSMDGPETISGVAPVAQRLELEFPVLVDEQTTVTSQFNPRRDAPLSLLIDRSGKIVRTRAGYSPGDERLIEADLKTLLHP